MTALYHLMPQPSRLITAEQLLQAYRVGFFPMAETDHIVLWHSPDPRAIIPLDHVHIARSVRVLIKKGVFTVRRNGDFEKVIHACADRPHTWISRDLIRLYCTLHEWGFAHSVEAWQDGQLVGGLYGVAIGGAFFGESMFSRVSNASKVCFAHLVEHLRNRGFILLDSQYANPFTISLGAIEIPRRQYLVKLTEALALECTF
ncbi:MAG: leucyl/phenylalanyl-tRNA--protein transferase [Bacteroidota bacterium]|nr:leucyl/phenylalanyl-tRNA--protein transferase [Candidatus Kapabacteria bacterium]MCX7936926.1 leucyl/phenylalanyl-tRNA--protein transferase [Chlorobiota bacterium]MDW8075295.1 leucyl/phenylalanyl-tRNA--protein transferase [Bacteroidota bacterium]